MLPERPDAAMIERYREDGYLAFASALTAEEVAEASDGINQLVRKYAFNDALTEHVGGGDREGSYGKAIKNGRGMLFKSRTSDFHFQVEGGYEARADRLDELADNIRKFQSYDMELPIYDYLAHRHPKLRALLGAVLGEDYAAYSSMALCKPAGGGAEKPWHQDLAYFAVNRFDGVAGVWIALDRAIVANGCMHVIPGGHRRGPRKHEWSRVDCEITTAEIDPAEAVAIELPPGGVLLFDGLLPHETPANQSPLRRRALQFHYRSAATQVVPREEYQKKFTGPEGIFIGCDYSKLATKE
ncbi:phytanoyl-CoA dioxygenase family protein [Horticoccus luteus]|uniref:Phytanoyl-CoA dioxygenase family protein n=1 Tax=Horticoccus luteus TaxID=2862869 RepID=A0A8F9TWG5_9BACT|nr:phytanoyl-CoA dioxygenase family protein [Horticoccus luteus]QYM79069.1 phytanoyl-CoA dioxygenase family protein [Horticoccus luteus]